MPGYHSRMMITGAPPANRRLAADMEAPQATRMRRARWRSPQLVAGILLVLVSTVVGVRVVAGVDESVPVLVAVRDLNPGLPLTDDLVEVRRVVLQGGHELYQTGPVGSGYVVQREVRAGELVPISSLAVAEELAEGDGATRVMALAVPSAEAPAGLSAGDVVDVWLTPAGEGQAELVASALTVTNAGTEGTFGVSGGQVAVTVAVRASDDDQLEEMVGRLVTGSRDGRIYLSRLP
jgi:hypothetical protein